MTLGYEKQVEKTFVVLILNFKCVKNGTWEEQIG